MPRLNHKNPIADTLTGYEFDPRLTPHHAAIAKPKAIRLKCLECCCGNDAVVRRCHISDCTLWPWRFGRPLKPSDLKKEEPEPDDEDDETI